MLIAALSLIYAAAAAPCPSPVTLPAEGVVTVQEDRAGLYVSLAATQSEGQSTSATPWTVGCPLEITLDGLELEGIDPDIINVTSSAQIGVLEEALSIPIILQVRMGRKTTQVAATATWSPDSVTVYPGGTEAETTHLYMKIQGTVVDMTTPGSVTVPTTTTGLLLPAVQTVR